MEITDLPSVRKFSEWCGDRSFPEVWAECPDPMSLFRVAVGSGVEKKYLVKAACAVAKTALKFISEGEDRPRLCIEAIEDWCDNPTAAAEDKMILAAHRAEALAQSVVSRGDFSEPYIFYHAYHAPHWAARGDENAIMHTQLRAGYQDPISDSEVAVLADLVRTAIPYEVVAAAVAAKGGNE